MEKLGAKLDVFNQAIKTAVRSLLKAKGVVSRFDKSCLVLVIHSEDAMFNLDSRRYLVEISEDELIDNEGYRYNFDSLKLEDLCTAIDSVADGITPTFQVVTSDDSGDEVSLYFEDKQIAYTEFVKIQCKGKEVRLGERQKELDRHGFPQYETFYEYLGEEIED